MPVDSTALKRAKQAGAAQPAAGADARGDGSGSALGAAPAPAKRKPRPARHTVEAGDAAAAAPVQGGPAAEPDPIPSSGVEPAPGQAADSASAPGGTGNPWGFTVRRVAAKDAGTASGASDADAADVPGADAGAAPAPDPDARPASPARRRRVRKPAGQPVSADEASDGAEQLAADDSAAVRSRTARPFWQKWPFIVSCVVVVALLAVVGAVSWDRWLRYDDAADFQGVWYADGTNTLITISADEIVLSSDVAYTYALDTGAKTLAFTFGTMEGQGRYRFSADRSQLVITDGAGYTWSSTLSDDLGWALDGLVRSIQGQPAEEVHAADGVTVLNRTPVEAAEGGDGTSADAASDGESADGEAAGAAAEGIAASEASAGADAGAEAAQ